MAIFAITVPCATTPTTTTTTTTVAPITFTATPSCVGGSGQIAVTNYAGGNGSYQWIAIGTSRINAISNVNGGTRFAAGTSYTFTSLTNGNYWVALRDTAGNVGATNDPGININCTTTTTTTTTTTSTTTTTTTAASVFYVRATNCADSADIRFFSYTDGPLNDGDVIQINSGANTGCWTLSFFKPGTGANGSITGLWTSIGSCLNCTI